MPQSEYYSGEKYIGNSVEKLAYFIEMNSKDSLVIQQIKTSERLTKIYPKIYFYSALTSGIGAIGLIYVIVKATGSIFRINNANPSSLITIMNASFGFMGIGMVGISVAAGYFISSEIKLRKAIKSYNNAFQTDKVSVSLQPYFQPNVAGLTVKINF